MKTFLLSTLLALTTALSSADSIVTFGANYTRSHIKPHALPDFDGNMGGLQGMYQYRPLDYIYAAVGGFWRYGSNSGSSGKRTLMDAGAVERLGYTIALRSNTILLTPYSGFGYRHLSHHLKPKIGSSIKLRYNEFYIPVGWQSEYELYDWFSIGFDAVWMPQVYPTVTINVIDGARWAIHNTYKNFNVAVPFHFFLCRKTTNFSFIVKPFFELWQDGATKARTVFNEPLGLPKNTYIFYGVDMNIQYTF